MKPLHFQPLKLEYPMNKLNSNVNIKMQRQKLTANGVQVFITQEIWLKCLIFSFNKKIVHLRTHTHTIKRFNREILDT